MRRRLVNDRQCVAAQIPELELRCGGRGLCGRCLVRIISGEFECDGRIVTAPAEIPACHSFLRSASGEVEFSADAPAEICSAWHAAPLLPTPESVVAFDVGTTTLAAVKIRNGAVVARAGGFNGQNLLGDNVITRISAPFAPLRRALLESVDRVLAQLDCSGVRRIVFAGNTVMSCYLHGLDPKPLGSAPFTPPAVSWSPATAGALGLAAAPADTEILTLPAAGAFIGGDVTGGAWESGLQCGELLLDVGTNCEMLFYAPSGIVGCAAAAGPAFEGAGIRCGSRAVRGAVSHVRADGSQEVIGGVPEQESVGWCGSALVDLVAALRRRGEITRQGRFTAPPAERRFGKNLVIDEKDLAQILLAKAAIRAGVSTLVRRVGMKPRRLLLAGAFARHLDVSNAIAIGMLPEIPAATLGNTSLGAAARLAVQPERFPEIERIAHRITEHQLSGEPGFDLDFIEALALP